MLLSRSDRGSERKQRRRKIKRFEAAVEAMDGRRLLSGSGATILLTGITVEVLGTNLGDTGSVSIQNGSVEVKLSNSAGSDDVLFPASQVGAVEFVGGSGKNTFTNNTSLTGILFGGSGDNVLTGGSGYDYLFATSTGTNVLNAGSGSEMLEALGNGTNTLVGGSGFTTDFMAAGNNHIVGGTGSEFVFTMGGQNLIDGGPGTAVVFSFLSSDIINPNAGMTVYHFGY